MLPNFEKRPNDLIMKITVQQNLCFKDSYYCMLQHIYLIDHGKIKWSKPINIMNICEYRLDRKTYDIRNRKWIFWHWKLPVANKRICHIVLTIVNNKNWWIVMRVKLFWSSSGYIRCIDHEKVLSFALKETKLSIFLCAATKTRSRCCTFRFNIFVEGNNENHIKILLV